jgi:hypothetical protein
MLRGGVETGGRAVSRENIAQVCPLARKVCYGKRKRALGAAARLAAHRGKGPIRVYKCEACRKWHLTSQAKTKARVTS